MNKDTIILIAFLVVMVTVDQMLEIDKGLFYAIFSGGVLSIELTRFIQFRRTIIFHQDKLIKLKSNEWLGAIPLAAYLIYSISDHQINLWMILAAIFILAIAGIYLSKNYNIVYVLDEEGIRNLIEIKKLNPKKYKKQKYQKGQLLFIQENTGMS
jgi:hypothetical protein